MKIFDMHIHATNTKPNPSDLISKMESVGIYGGCVFSNRSVEFDPSKGTSFEERLSEVMAWQKGYEDRIFPILWIHPYEDDIFSKIQIAVDKGVCGFKIICGDFYIYEDRCMQVLSEIAKTGKPVMFHTGILWDYNALSVYNKPLNWEPLSNIKGLRFSMGHCSWPWYDECIALYGKFLNNLLRTDSAEMFVDITPGTPQIHREALLTTLYTTGYDVGDNIMFGTDCNAHNYNGDWANEWLKTDCDIMDKLNVSKENREKLYYHNLLRFLGKTDVKIKHISPECDNSHKWLPY